MKAIEPATTGVLLVDKPAGLTSADVVSRLRRIFSMKRIGHAGTLDPMATGLLVCLLGQCTRLASYAESGEKGYSGTIRLGVVTSSDDITGEILKEEKVSVDLDSITKAIQKLTGPISQIPPKVSAIKIKGKRAYDLARKGEDFEISSRSVTVSSFDFSRINENTLEFNIACSKGTYIRSLARDLGEMLGCGACLETLRRTASAPFNVKEALPLESITHAALRDWAELFPKSPKICLNEQEAQALSMGRQASLKEVVSSAINRGEITGTDQYVVYSSNATKKALGLLIRKDNLWEFGVNIGS